MNRRTIADMQPGDIAWTLPWALHEAHGQLWLNPDYPVYDQPAGTVQMCIARGRENYGTRHPERGYVIPAGLAHWSGPTPSEHCLPCGSSATEDDDFDALSRESARLFRDTTQLSRDSAQISLRSSILAMATTSRHLRQQRAAIVFMSTIAAVSGYVFTQADTAAGATASLVGLIAGCISAAVCLKIRSSTLDQLARDMHLWGEAHDQSSAASP